MTPPNCLHHLHHLQTGQGYLLQRPFHPRPLPALLPLHRYPLLLTLGHRDRHSQILRSPGLRCLVPLPNRRRRSLLSLHPPCR